MAKKKSFFFGKVDFFPKMWPPSVGFRRRSPRNSTSILKFCVILVDFFFEKKPLSTKKKRFFPENQKESLKKEKCGQNRPYSTHQSHSYHLMFEIPIFGMSRRLDDISKLFFSKNPRPNFRGLYLDEYWADFSETSPDWRHMDTLSKGAVKLFPQKKFFLPSFNNMIDIRHICENIGF